MKTKIIVLTVIMSVALPVSAASIEKQGFGASTQVLSGKLSGKTKKYSLVLDPYLYQSLFSLPNYTCTGYSSLGACYNAISIDREDQKNALMPLVNWLTKKNKKSDDRIRVAASLVQDIPYDNNKASGTEIISSGRGHGSRYPYETVFENAGICGEKSMLMAFLFKQLGYGVALITFISPSVHEVAAVKCADAYDFRNTGYCFVDPSYRHMITFGGSWESRDPYLVIPIAEGKTFSAENDWKDSRSYWTLATSINSGVYTKKQLKAYNKLIKKYGL